MDKGNWWDELNASITVTSADGTILEMNRTALTVFAADGGEDLIGRNVLDCHPEPARTRTARLYSSHEPNHYTITKNGQKKIIHQIPWLREGAFAGVVEISIPIPNEMPHFNRDSESAPAES
jgi:transcriptional regulator with PAS, ATPase and Fis domain